MPSQRDQWVSIVRPVLGAIRSHANWIKYHGEQVSSGVRMLPARPDFETEAQAEIDVAIGTLTNALELLCKAKEAYGNKPIEERQK